MFLGRISKMKQSFVFVISMACIVILVRKFFVFQFIIFLYLQKSLKGHSVLVRFFIFGYIELQSLIISNRKIISDLNVVNSIFGRFIIILCDGQLTSLLREENILEIKYFTLSLLFNKTFNT